MKPFSPKKTAKNVLKENFETIEIEYICTSEKEAAKRICAAVRALLEIDQILEKRESVRTNLEAA
jgi:hypothetical protein